MKELCKAWDVDKSHTTPYHPQANGVVERGNRVIGDSLRALLLGACHVEWDLLLLQIMRAHRAVPHSGTGETPTSSNMGVSYIFLTK